jgi:hypothetical protein
MAWTWTGFVENLTTSAVENPEMSALTSIFLAFFAGFEFRGAILMIRSHSGTAFDYFGILVSLAVLLAVSSLRGYALVKGIRRIQSSSL